MSGQDILGHIPVDNNSDSLSTSEDNLQDCVRIMDWGINGRIETAVEMCDSRARTSLYHSHGKSLLLFIKAMFTLDERAMALAMEALNRTHDMGQKCTRNRSIGNRIADYIWGENFNDYTDEEVHAHLILAENSFFKALLIIFSNRNLLSLVKAALRIRSSQAMIRQCVDISLEKTEWKSESLRTHFISGVHFANGGLNILFSHLHKRLVQILQMFGFSGDRTLGMQTLCLCCEEPKNVRYLGAQLILVAYETYFIQAFGDRKPDLDLVDKMVNQVLEQEIFKKSSWFLWFKARMIQLRGDIDNAILYYNKCIDSQHELKPMHNICHWELVWCHTARLEWRLAAKYAQLLIDQCKWSVATFHYQLATFLYMQMIEENRPEMHEQVSELMRRVPRMKVRFAGKTIPPEKYICANVAKYFAQNESLVLPAFDLFYIWNGFSMIERNAELIEPIIKRIDRTIQKCYLNDKDSVNALENYLLLLLLKGVCHKCLKEYKCAERYFNEIIRNERHIRDDKFLLPMASFEMGLTKLEDKSYSEAKQWLKRAKNGYSGYLLETIIHLKAYSALQSIERNLKANE